MAGRFEHIAERHLDPVVRGANEYMTACPFCQGNSSLQFNIDTGLWLCFKCDAKGSAKSLVRRLGGTYADPAVSVDTIREKMDRMRTRAKKKDQSLPILDDSVLSRYNFSDGYWSEHRGLSDETIAEWELGYDPIMDRNVIPFRSVDGDLLGVIQRIKGKDVVPRYIYPKHFDRKESFFGSWKLHGTAKCAIVEGSTDVIALSQASRPALGQYGSSISSKQARLLYRLGIREAVLFYDCDEAGRKALERSREELTKYGIILRAVRWDSRKYCFRKKLCNCGDHTWRTIGKCQNKILCQCGRKHEADPGSLTIKEIRRMYDNAKLVGGKKWRT